MGVQPPQGRNSYGDATLRHDDFDTDLNGEGGMLMSPIYYIRHFEDIYTAVSKYK
jgi:hypothetical protein